MIIHPITKIGYNIHSNTGRQILQEYLINYKHGGSGFINSVRDSTIWGFNWIKSFFEDVDEIHTEPPRIPPRDVHLLQKRASKLIDIEIQLPLEFLENKEWWVEQINKILDQYEKKLEDIPGRKSPIGRISPHSFVLERYVSDLKDEAYMKLLNLEHDGYHLETTVEGDFSGYFIADA